MESIFSNNNEIDPRFAKTVFCVEANSFETLELWDYWKDKVKWEDEGDGVMYQTGEIDNRPICTTMSWSKIDGQYVLFYDNTSQVVDNVQVEKWFKAHCNPTWDKGTRRAFTDSMNFYHCIDAVQEKNGEI